MGFIPTVQKFLFCLSLEIGGYVCGIFTGVVSTISLISALSIIFTSLSSNYSAGWWTVMIINLIVLGLLIYASVMLFFGTKNSEPNKMRLYLIFMVVSVVFAFLQIIVSSWAAIIVAIIWTIVVVYIFVCIYSLFKHLGGTSILW